MAKNNGIESEKPWSAARSFRDRLAARGKRVVMTNGCFDLLHAGHVHLLKTARCLGDALVVAVNSDASIRALKGKERPIYPEEDRVAILEELACVDAVIVYDDVRAASAIEAIAPDIYVKGGDYDLATLDPREKAVLDRIGCEITFVPLVAGRSTTGTLARADQATARFRLGFMGSGRGGTLQALINAIDDGRLCAEIVLVISDVAESGVLRIAQSRGIEGYWIDPGTAKTRFADEAQCDVADRLKMLEVELVILGGFMRRLKLPFIEQFPQRIVNIHPSLLPQFPGREAWQQALAAGVVQTGTTVHLVDEGLDTGRILAQAPVPIIEGDTPETLLDRIQEAEGELYPRVIGEYGALLRGE